MSYLIPNSTPAQRARGQSFGEKFQNAAKVALNRGTVFGTPTIDFGAVLNGTTDYIQYQLSGNEFNSSSISIKMDFWPDFDTDLDSFIYLFDTTSTDRYFCVKNNNAAANVLLIRLGGTDLSPIPEASYSPYWLVGQRNQLSICSDGSNTEVKLNDNLILSDSTSWSPKKPISLFVGSRFSSANMFPGVVTLFEIYKSLLTAQEASDFYNHSTYNYRNKAVLDLPMLDADHTGGVGTRDVSPAQNTITFGVGEPTKNAKRGYFFDGVDDNFAGLPVLTGSYTVMVQDDSGVNFYNDSTVYDTIGASGGFSGNLYSLQAYDYLMTQIQQYDLAGKMMRSINRV